MGKYEPLRDHLKSLSEEQWSASFEEVERILGFPLPRSAYTQRAWWSNNASNSVMSKEWMEAGWKTEQVDMAGRKLVFRRVDHERNARFWPQRRQSRSVSEQATICDELTVRGIDHHTLGRLAAIAELTGRSINEVARDILSVGSRLSREERVALSDGIRSRMPKFDDLDIGSLIREGRDDW